MASNGVADRHESTSSDLPDARLYVVWQDPDSRAVEPVGRLDRVHDETAAGYEFRYLQRVKTLSGFQPFVSFPDFHRVYRSSTLFPLFENRLVPRSRADYEQFTRSVGLGLDADPFEVLARTEGRRETDTIEMFPEPIVDDGSVRCHLLIHGIRHVAGADDAIEQLAPGQPLLVVPDPQNAVDPCAILVRDDACHLIGWIPRYLTTLVRDPLAHLGPGAVQVIVEHVGDRSGPVHLRLLCALRAHWPHDEEFPFSGPEFAPVG